MPEIQSAEYYSRLRDEIERANVRRFVDFIHSYLLRREINSTMIAYGSVVTGIRSNGDDKESDIDTRVFANSRFEVDKLVQTLDALTEAPEGFTLEREEIHTRFRPVKGRPIEFVYKSAGQFWQLGDLTFDAGTNLRAQRKVNEPFAILYQDRKTQSIPEYAPILV